MTRKSYRPAGIAALAIGLLASASPVPAYADHQIYPPDWNTPTTVMAPVLYQFVPGGSRLHVMPPGTTAPAASPPSAGASAAVGQSARPQ